jgi:pantothenate synthetase
VTWGRQQALTEAGVPLDDDLVVSTRTGSKRAAAEALGTLLSLREPPTAVFAEQDEVAVALVWKLIDDSDGDHERHIVRPTHVIPHGTTAPVAARSRASAATAAAREDQSARSASE